MKQQEKEKTKRLTYFYSEEEKQLIISSISNAKSLQEKEAIYKILSKKLNKPVKTLISYYNYAKNRVTVKKPKFKAPVFGKGTVLNFPVTRAVLEEGKVTLYFD